LRKKDKCSIKMRYENIKKKYNLEILYFNLIKKYLHNFAIKIKRKKKVEIGKIKIFFNTKYCVRKRFVTLKFKEEKNLKNINEGQNTVRQTVFSNKNTIHKSSRNTFRFYTYKFDSCRYFVAIKF